MISTCTDSIKNDVEVTNALTGLEYDFALTSEVNKLFYISLDTSQSIYVKVLIKNATVRNSVVFVNIISKKDLVTVRTIKLQASTVITADLDMGDYYICVRTLLGVFDISLTVDYLRYSREITFNDIQIKHGDTVLLEELKIKRAEVECSRPLKYTFISGRLPTGIKMDSKGRLYGTLPIIDDENMKNFPSYNLYHSNFDFTTPIGVRYEFRVRIEVEGNDAAKIYEERDFCMMLVNDWSLTEPIMGAEVYDITGEVDKYNPLYGTSNGLLPASLCPPCILDVDKNNIATYVFDKNGATMLAERIDDSLRWYFNDYGSITKNNYTSRTPLIKHVVQLDYVINAHDNDDNDSEYIHIPDVILDETNEYVILPNNLDGLNVYEWVLLNINSLVDAGYNKTTLNKYINKQIKGDVTFRNGRMNLDLIHDRANITDPQTAYTVAHEDIMRNEPMYIRGTFIPYELDVELIYESYT